MKNEIFWTQDYIANSFLVNPQKKLGLFGALNLLQDSAWSHAIIQGVGYEDMLRTETLWVLTRQKLVMEEWPDWGAQVQIQTWSRAPRGNSVCRDFEVWCNGRKYGECTTSWLILDLNSRRPRQLNFPANRHLHREEGCLNIEATKIEPQATASTLVSFDVRNSDLDPNGHVNNTRYAQWILDSIPIEIHRKNKLKSYEVNFLAETRFGDRIQVQSCVLSTNLSNGTLHHFQGKRESDQKIVFTARLEVEPL